MRRSHNLVLNRRALGDAAVDGIFGGIQAGLVMLAFLLVAGLASGVTPGRTLALFDAGGRGSILAGAIGHLGVSAMYGAAFGVLHGVDGRLASHRGRTSIALGAAYGVGLWLVAEYVVLPVTSPALGELPLVRFLMAHIIYGFLLGWLVARYQRP
jgi:hypothetical protein